MNPERRKKKRTEQLPRKLGGIPNEHGEVDLREVGGFEEERTSGLSLR